uniref:Putative secreted protein n=1 Tax=Anopheles marajoara TaxID=58244 RepID=A0A2M4C307_9DIPT
MFSHKSSWLVTLALTVLFIGCSLALPARDDGKDGKELSEFGSPNGTIHEEVVVGASLYVRKKPERSQSRQLLQPNANRQIFKREIRVQQAEGYDQSKSHNDKSSVGATEALKRSKTGASTGGSSSSSKTAPATRHVNHL